MNMTLTETQAASEPRPWDSFKGPEKAFMLYIAKQGIHFVRMWLQDSENQNPIDETAFGLTGQDMQVLALRVARHLTGAQPIPEIVVERRPVADIALGVLFKTLRADLDRLGQALAALEGATLSAFPAAVQEAKKALQAAQSRVRAIP